LPLSDWLCYSSGILCNRTNLGSKPVVSEQIGKSRIHSPASLFIGWHSVERGRGNVLVSEGLFHNGEVNVLRDEGKSQRMFQAMGMTPIRWQSRSFGNVLKHAEKLASEVL